MEKEKGEEEEEREEVRKKSVEEKKEHRKLVWYRLGIEQRTCRAGAERRDY